MPDFPAYTPTRFRYLGVSRMPAPSRAWSYVCLDFAGGGSRPDCPARIGPLFRTQAEAMGALPEYAARNYPEPAR